MRNWQLNGWCSRIRKWIYLVEYFSCLQCKSYFFRFGILLILFPFGVSAQQAPAYYEDIQPIIVKNCLPCHRDGEAAPFSLETYEDVARRAKFIQMVTESRYMPPWHADPEFSTFRNQRVLTDAEIKLIADWVAGGKKRGKAPSGEKNIVESFYPEPNMELKMNPFTIPGDATEQFRLFVIPTNTEEDLYVKGIDFQPGNLRLAHHARLMLDTTHLFRVDDGAMVSDTIMPRNNVGVALASYFWYGWVPGNFATLYPEGIGKRLPKYSDILLNMHYSPTTSTATDQSTVRIYLTKEKPKRFVKTFVLDESWITNQPFVIPANQVVKFYMRSPLIPADLSLINVLPHMHLLGKSFKAYAITPQGKIINIINIKEWDFNWQMTYQFEHLVKLPKGSVVYAEAVFDNTSDNHRNPHFPPKDVTYGWGTFNEMMNLIFEYLDYEPGDETLDLFSPSSSLEVSNTNK